MDLATQGWLREGGFTERTARTDLREEQGSNLARMVASYCWPWANKKDPNARGSVIPEHDVRARWNLTQDGGLWMVFPSSVNEVGCIHTCQGLEVDYIGVIVGPDLIVCDGQVITDPSKRDRSDNSIRGWKKKAKQESYATRKLTDAIIKNTYRTLIARGMKGRFVFCVDGETSGSLRKRIG